MISQLRAAIPPEKLKEQPGWGVFHRIQATPLISNTTFGIARQSSSLVSFE